MSLSIVNCASDLGKHVSNSSIRRARLFLRTGVVQKLRERKSLKLAQFHGKSILQQDALSRSRRARARVFGRLGAAFMTERRLLAAFALQLPLR